MKVRSYLSLVKFSHTIFAMPFAVIGFFLGAHEQGGEISWQLLALIALCMVFARNAAMGFNRYADARYDAANPRTSNREIPAKQISSLSALLFVIANSLLFIATTWFINDLCFYLSPVALITVLGYTYTKRFTWLCHLVLGLGLSLAPIGAYIAVTSVFAWLPICFSLCVIFWVSGFDVIYALQDKDFDASQSLYSLPVRFGIKGALRISELLHICAILPLVIAGIIWLNIPLYWLAIAVFSALLIYQHRLVKPDDLSRLNLAFFTTNGIASLVFAGLVILGLVI